MYPYQDDKGGGCLRRRIFAMAYLPSSPRKIAVLHAKALGDLLVILPALGAIKETYPDAELILLARTWVKEFLSTRSSVVDRVIRGSCIPGGQ